MTIVNLAAIDAAFRASWALDTCGPVDIDDWTPQNPSRAQCAVTSLVLHDLFGGDIAEAEVWVGERLQGGHHSWLRTAAGLQIDLTLEQFAVLHRRVFDRLGLQSALR